VPLPEIQLDDRNFETIVADARRRIPGYTPEWTDLNESDPGIVLVQLFAWLSEMIIWRLNRVPEKNFIKFLELIDVKLRPPAPARAELTFKLSAKDLPFAVPIPQGTRVSLVDQVDGQQVIFETEDNLNAVGVELTALQSFDGAQFQLLTEANRVEGKFFYPLGRRPQKDSALYLGFDRAFPPGRFTLTIHAYTAGRIAEGKGIPADSATPPPPVVGVWEYWAGDQAKWRRLSVVDDTTGSLTNTGTLVFESPATAAVAVKLGLLRTDQDKPLFWFRFRIAETLGSGYPIPPQLEDVLLNTVSATNAVTVNDELLGASNGMPNQSFPLANAPVLLERFDLQVDEGDGFKSWKRVEDFAKSGREDRRYTLDPARGVVYFGDGKQGKIPERLTEPSRPNEDLPNIKVATYRWGGGARGNAGAKKINSLESTVPYVESVTNLRPSFGGQDEESLEEARRRAPEVIRTRSRAVTAEDFEFLASQAPGGHIRRAHALPMRHPDFQPIRPAGAGIAASDIPVPGVVTVVVIPESLDDPKPMPNEETLKLVAQWLDQHKLITTEVFAAAPKYRRVEIEARVKARPTALSGQVAEELKKMLLNYFHPLRGGKDGIGWEFGGTISFSEVYRRILNTPGVAQVEGSAVTIFVDDQRTPPCQDIPINKDELVYSTDHKIIVSYV
jgi:predicted phage baseplate assembly protein